MNILGKLLDQLDRLITEHGSAAVLRQHLELLKAQLADYEAKHTDLQKQKEEMEARALDAEHRAREAEHKLQALQAGQNMGHACEACGSADIHRTGTRPSQGPFGKLGLKEGLFTCNRCGHVTAIELPMP